MNEPMVITGKHIFLRTVQPSDTEILFRWENSASSSKTGRTAVRFTRDEIRNFVLNSYHDIFLEKQLRWMICLLSSSQPIGCIDLFDFDERTQSASIGILIAETCFRRNGFATESLSLLIRYCFEKLQLAKLQCIIASNNLPSLKLFTKQGFCPVPHKTSKNFEVSLRVKHQPRKKIPAGFHFLQLLNQKYADNS